GLGRGACFGRGAGRRSRGRRRRFGCRRPVVVVMVMVVHAELVFGCVDGLLAPAEKLVEESHRVRLLLSSWTGGATRVSQERAGMKRPPQNARSGWPESRPDLTQRTIRRFRPGSQVLSTRKKSLRAGFRRPTVP